MPNHEQHTDPSQYHGKLFEAQIQEGEGTFQAHITDGTETIVFVYTPPGKVSFEIVTFGNGVSSITEATIPPPASPKTAQERKETEKPVKLRGRFGIDFKIKNSPSGGTMAVSSFAEHPNRAVWSYSNTLAEKPTKETIWWPIAAFDERVELANGIHIGKEYDITCFLRQWVELEKGGKEKTVTGLYLLEAQPFVRQPRKEPS